MANKCALTIEGRLVADPELKYARNGTAFVNARLAHSRKDKAAEGGYASDFYSITAYDATAEIMAQFKKGQAVQIEGRLKKTEYENKAGVRVRDVEIMASRIIGVNSPAKDGTSGTAGASGGTGFTKKFSEVDMEDEGLAEE